MVLTGILIDPARKEAPRAAAMADDVKRTPFTKCPLPRVPSPELSDH